MSAHEATAAEWRCLHSHWVDAVFGQDPEIVEVLLRRFGGVRSGDFMRGLLTGLCRVRSAIEQDDVLVYVIEVLAGDDSTWLAISRPAAGVLGFADTEELRDAEIQWHADRMIADLERGLDQLDGDDDSPP